MRLPVLILAALVSFAALYALGGSVGDGDSDASGSLPERVGSVRGDEPISLGPPPRLPSAAAPARAAPDRPEERPAARAPSPAPDPEPAPPPQEEPPAQPEPQPRPEPAPRPDPAPRPPAGAPPFSDVE